MTDKPKTLKELINSLDYTKRDGDDFILESELRAEAVKRAKWHKRQNELHRQGMIDKTDKYSYAQHEGAIMEIMDNYNLSEADLRGEP